MATTTQTQTQSHSHVQHSIQLLHSSAANGHGIGGMPHGLGLLTTVASLPPKYRSRYLSIKTKTEIPLDLSVKPISPQMANDVPMASQFTEVYTEPASITKDDSPSSTEIDDSVEKLQSSPKSEMINEMNKVSSLKPTPANEVDLKRPKIDDYTEINDNPPAKKMKLKITNQAHLLPQAAKFDRQPEATPSKPIKLTDTAPRTGKSQTVVHKPSRNKATRKLKFDEETSSPVSGTIIRPLEDITDGTVQYSNGDIDPKYNIVEITEETKAELAAIKNVIGDYVCKLCRLKFDDAFGLARHRCACIVLLEYRCPECGKQFNCPANLASHRRWHKPKKEVIGNTARKENRNTTNTQHPQKQLVQQQTNNKQQSPRVFTKTDDLAHSCDECGKTFKRHAYLRKHQLTHARREHPTLVSDVPTVEFNTKEPQQTTNVAKYSQYAPSSSASSQHSYSGTHEDEGIYTVTSGYDYEMDSLSDCSSSSAGYGRLQIIESGLTEEENIAAAALTNLRNCASVIQHTTLAH